MTPLFSAVYGCFKLLNTPNFKETIDMLKELGADSTVTIKYGGKQATAQQVAVLKMISDVVERGYHYDYFDEKIGSCASCTAMKDEIWDELDEEMFTECFNKCSDAPCYPKFP